MILEAHAARVVVGTTDVPALLVWNRAFDSARIGRTVQPEARARGASTTWRPGLHEEWGKGTGIEGHARVAVVARAVLAEPDARDCGGQDFALWGRPHAGEAVCVAGWCSGSGAPRVVAGLARGASLDAPGERQRRGEREPLGAAEAPRNGRLFARRELSGRRAEGTNRLGHPEVPVAMAASAQASLRHLPQRVVTARPHRVKLRCA